MYIKKLELCNFQVIEKFDAEFTGNVYFVTGENELGKSTLLKAIGALLTGKRDDVLRNGATKGFAEMIVGDDGEEFEVRLSFTENNPRGTLSIRQKSTGMQTDNVSMLQRIFGYTDFDAVEFSRWGETAEGRRKQIAVVKSLLPAPVRERIEAIDTEMATLKAERTGINRDIKTFDTLVASARAKLAPGDIEKYAHPMDIAALMERQRTNAALAEKAKTAQQMLKQRTEQLAGIAAEIEAEEKRHAEVLADIEARRAEYATRKATCEKWLADYEKTNAETTDVSALLEQAEAHNKKHALVEEYNEKRKQFEDVAQKSQKMDAQIEELGNERAKLITNANLPIEGLTFTDEGLELNGIPFVPGKVSDSQTMEIAAKLIIASNPTVKVFRIARGESLGAKRLQTIIDIAKKNGFQGFIEQVQRGQNEMQVEEYTEA